MVLSVSPGIPYGNLQQMIRDCKEKIKEKLDIQVSIYINLNLAKAAYRSGAAPMHLGVAGQWLRTFVKRSL